MNVPRVACLAVLSFTLAQTAFAADLTPWYAGAGLGLDNGRVDCLSEFKCDGTDKAFKLFAGYRIAPLTELQLTWFHAGHFNGGNVAPLGTHFGGEYGVTGYAFTGGYRWDVGHDVTVIGRGGLAITRANFDYTDPDYGGDKGKSTAQPYGGASALYALTPDIKVGLDYDLTRFEAHRDHGVLQTFGLSAQYSF